MHRRRPFAEDEDANQLRFGQEFENEQCLLAAEVATLLQLARDQKVKQGDSVSDIMTKTIDYCTRTARFTNDETVRQVKSLFPFPDYSSFEAAQIANLCSDSTEEIKALVPSLARVDEDILQKALNEMHQLRKMQPSSMM